MKMRYILTGTLGACEGAVCEKHVVIFESEETLCVVRHSHQGGRSERWRRDAEDDSTLWGIYASTEGWL